MMARQTTALLCCYLLLQTAQLSESKENKWRDILWEAAHTIHHAPRTSNDAVSSSLTRSSDTSNNKFVTNSFGVLSDRLGNVADGLRVTGDTMGGVMASSIKILGAAVKSAGSKVGSTAIKLKPSAPPTSRSQSTKRRQRRRRHVVQSSRMAAAKTVNVMGQVVQELGDMLVLTGAATESIAGMTTALVEDGIRILEKLTADLAERREPRRLLIRPRQQQQATPPSVGPTFSFGSHEEEEPTDTDDSSMASFSIVAMLMSLLDSIHQDTAGVPSQAPELLVVFLLCFFAAIATLKSAVQTHEIVIVNTTTKSPRRTAMTWNIFILLLPIRLLILLVRLVVFLIWNRYTFLLSVYGLAWMHACRLSQLRSQTIQSGAEAHGYRYALESLHSSSSVATKEPTLWLNNLVEQQWRVPSPTCPSAVYPKYVLDGIPGCKTTCLTESCYGGLEPYLSYNIGSILAQALESSKMMRPSSIAFASLDSISLGSRPPVIRSVQILYKDAQKTEYLMEVDLSLQDLMLVLDMKLSSLDYAFLPTTQVAVTSLMMSSVKLKVTTHASPVIPFVSNLELSLQSLPDVTFKFSPLSEESGLKGVDLGSLPLVRDWIQGALKQTMAAYVSPRYVSIDMQAWYQGMTTTSSTSSSSSSPFVAASGSTKTTSRRHYPKRQPTDHKSSLPRLSLIRPQTPAAKLGMERWMELEEKAYSL